VWRSHRTAGGPVARAVTGEGWRVAVVRLGRERLGLQSRHGPSEWWMNPRGHTNTLACFQKKDVGFTHPTARFGFGGGETRRDEFGLLAEGFVDGGFHPHPRRIGDGADGAEVVAVQVACHAVGEFHGGRRIGQHRLLPRHQPVAHLDRAKIHGRHGGGGDRRAIGIGGEVFEFFRRVLRADLIPTTVSGSIVRKR
jgi:hypothetical protein